MVNLQSSLIICMHNFNFTTYGLQLSMVFLNGMLRAHVKTSYIWQPNYLYTIMYQHQQ
jgi:hypothetical protein